MTSPDRDNSQARLVGVRSRARAGDYAGAVRELKALVAELSGQQRRDEALEAALEGLTLAPDDPEFRLALVEVRIRERRVDEALAVAREILNADPARWLTVVRLAESVSELAPEPAHAVGLLVADHLAARSEWQPAAMVLQDLAARRPGDRAVLIRLIDVARLGGLVEIVVETEDALAGLSAATPSFAAATAGPEDPDHKSDTAKSGDDADFAYPSGDVLEEELDLDAIGDDAPPSMPAAFPLVASAPSDDLDDVFAGFRQTAPRQLIIDAGEQELTRGLAHMAEGRIEQALASLEIAAQVPKLRFLSAAALGRIHRDQQRPHDALRWMERAAEAPAPSEQEAQQLLYDLVKLLEFLGEHARALAICLSLQADGAPLPDLESRITRLMGQESGG